MEGTMKSICTMTSAILILGISAAGGLKAAPITVTNLGTVSGSLTLSGALVNQGAVVEEMFNLASPASLTIYTTSYGGGPNLDGTTSVAGGFQPMISLYTGTGVFVMQE